MRSLFQVFQSALFYLQFGIFALAIARGFHALQDTGFLHPTRETAQYTGAVFVAIFSDLYHYFRHYKHTLSYKNIKASVDFLTEKIYY